MKKVVPFDKARETSLYGSKAVGLGDAAAAGTAGTARRGAVGRPGRGGRLRRREGDREAGKSHRRLAAAVCGPVLGGRRRRRSASFAGQHLTLLNVHSAADVAGAVREVWWSANSDSAITYRQKVGLFTRPSVGVVVQSLLNPQVAGVMFTEHPVTGADERLIEASWGLGEAVVAGLVVPDHFRLDRVGAGAGAQGGAQAHLDPLAAQWRHVRTAGPPERVSQLCLDEAHLAALGELALQCEKVYGPRRDIEWAIQDGTLYLLQCRAVTTGKAESEAPPPLPPRHDPVAAIQRVDSSAGMDRRQAEQIGKLLKERHFAKGETVIMEGSGAAAFFLIDSGEAVTRKGVEIATLGRATISARSR